MTQTYNYKSNYTTILIVIFNNLKNTVKTSFSSFFKKHI